MYRFVKLSLLYVAIVPLISCNERHDGIEVGNLIFCVPSENDRQSDIAWLPRELPKGGFRFGLKVTKDLVGYNSDISGLVDNASGYRDWSHPKVGSEYANVLHSARSIRSSARDGLYVAVRSPGASYSLLVREKANLNPNFGSESDGDELIATCDIVNGSDSDISVKPTVELCNRVVAADSVYIQYRFDERLLGKIERMDELVRSTVLAWRC